MTDRTDLLIILDRSGSMQDGRADHEGGLRAFVRDAARLAGDVRLTFVRFDSHDPCEVIFEARPVADVKAEELTLTPRGGTPLLDAVGQALTRFAGRLSERTVCMIITDGEENQSREWTKARVQALAKEREAAGWKLLYLGANVDAFAEAGAVGVPSATTAGYRRTTRGIEALYRATMCNLTMANNAYAGAVATADATASRTDIARAWAAASKNLAFTPEQRTALMDETKENT